MSSTIASLLPAEGSLIPGLPPSPEPVLQPVGKGQRTRRKHFAIAALSSLAALLFFAFIAFHGYVAWIIAHPYVAPLTSNPKLAKGLAYSDISFPSKSGRTTVHGWYIPASAARNPGAFQVVSGTGTPAADRQQSTNTAAVITEPSARTVIFSHGYGANREETWVPMYELAALMNRLHYNVIMFDYGYASSVDRSPATGGYEESQQLLAAIDYARAQGTKELIVWGFSMGAGTALQAALQTDQIDAMILDSLFLPTPESLYGNVTQYLELPKFPSLPLIEWMLPFWTGTNFNHIPAEHVMNNAYSMPIFIMHGTQDAKAPVDTAKQIAHSQHNPLSQQWIVEGGKHELLFQTRPREYIQRAALFLSQVSTSAESSAASKKEDI
ncbi:alpha/beta hydrolase [Paenibacillus sp. GCM10027626]|uniref:alpha/beta hydrolase n=1 Tax=Paenibacillus sp. GCM10027626 TaxID=3273411 RepID=UPI00362759B0